MMGCQCGTELAPRQNLRRFTTSSGDSEVCFTSEVSTSSLSCATYLSYRGEVYQQTSGTAMGFPVSVPVANLVMEDVEQRALATSEAQPPFWKRYVDDTLTALPKDQI